MSKSTMESRVALRHLNKTSKRVKTLWIVSNPNEHSEIGDMVAEADAASLGQLAIGTGASRWKHENTALHDDAKSAVSDALDRLKKFYKNDIPGWVLRNVGGEKGARSWKPSRVALDDMAPDEVDLADATLSALTPDTVAPSAEGMFHLPESSEVREFAQSEAITNVVEVAEEAASELDESVAEAVEQAEEAPPTPEEIEEEPGASDVSTLNRFLVEPPIEVEGKTAELRRRYFDL